jgi:very-short-patch-repair endonuclease
MPTKKELTPLGRTLRRNQTEAETRLWSHLRARQMTGHKFTRQTPIGPYIADFLCHAAKLVIELDGGQHAESAADAERTAALTAMGYFTLRFWNHDVLQNTDGVLEAISQQLTINSTPP